MSANHPQTLADRSQQPCSLRSARNEWKAEHLALFLAFMRRMLYRFCLTKLHLIKILEVTNCYAIPFRESGNDTPEINDSINRSMLMISKKSSPTEQIVGWCVPILYHSHMNFRFFTVPDLPDTCAHYHTYYTNLMAQEATKKEQPPVILLTMDVTFGENPNRLPVKAFTAYIILFFICKLFILMISEGMQEFRGKTKSKHTFSTH